MIRFDKHAIRFFTHAAEPTSRIAFFLVFFWFGLLKVTGDSPAGPLVEALLHKTLGGAISPEQFFVLFGAFEMLIGVLFLIRGMERAVLPLFFLHIVTTILPLFLLPAYTWQSIGVPTLEGQYIIKNTVLIALAMAVAAHLKPFSAGNLRPKS